MSNGDQSKWDILKERYKNAQRMADDTMAQLIWMENTTFGRPCSGCGRMLDTEADFAKHFLIPDTGYLNLGYCPDEVTR